MHFPGTSLFSIVDTLICGNGILDVDVSVRSASSFEHHKCAVDDIAQTAHTIIVDAVQLVYVVILEDVQDRKDAAEKRNQSDPSTRSCRKQTIACYPNVITMKFSRELNSICFGAPCALGLSASNCKHSLRTQSTKQRLRWDVMRARLHIPTKCFSRFAICVMLRANDVVVQKREKQIVLACCSPDTHHTCTSTG